MSADDAEFMSADDGGCKTDSAELVTKTDAIRAVPDWSGVYWRESVGTLVFGHGASLGMSHRAEQVQAASCGVDAVERIKFANPLHSIVGSPSSSFLAVLTEFGLLGLLSFSILIGLLVNELWRHRERLDLLVVLVPFVMLWLLTPALESPVLPAVLGLAVLAMPASAKDGSERSFASH